MPSDVAAGKTEDGGRDETGDTESNSSQKSLRQSAKYTDPPSRLVLEWARLLAGRVPSRRRGLDVAMGRGRHLAPLAQAGFLMFGVDIKFDAVVDAVTRAAASGIKVRGWCADLTTFPLPENAFELVVVTRYLQRDLFGCLRNAIVAGGAVIYETFTIHQRSLGRRPTSPDHLLRPGELKERFAAFDLLLYEEVEQPDALARLVATKPNR